MTQSAWLSRSDMLATAAGLEGQPDQLRCGCGANLWPNSTSTHAPQRALLQR